MRASRDTGGLGIGLALVRQLVELQGGTVRAYSDDPGKGARICVRWPLAQPTVASDPVSEAATNGVDATEILEPMAALLEMEGARVTMRANAGGAGVCAREPF